MRTITDKQAGKFAVLVLLTAVFFAVLPGCSSDRPVESVATSFNSVNGNLPTIATTPDTTLGHGDDGWFHMAKESAYTLRVIKWNPKNENPPDTTEFYLAECVYVNQYSTYSAYQWWSTALGYGTYMMLRNCESSVNDVEWEMPNVWAREDIAIDTVCLVTIPRRACSGSMPCSAAARLKFSSRSIAPLYSSPLRTIRARSCSMNSSTICVNRWFSMLFNLSL